MPNGTEPLYSTLADDPDLGEIVEMFVNEMPDRVENLMAQLESGDWDSLRRTAHQLKGAAGSYGFETISPSAAIVEDAIRNGNPEETVRQAVQSLVDLCQRATASVPS
jgi:HPt (histidine-containing phosphotransfer) domain-containing protein